MPSRVQAMPYALDEATAEARQIIAAANAEADRIIINARERATETYELELRRSVQRLAKTRDEYELLSRRLRALKEATVDLLTTAVRDHKAMRRVFDDYPEPGEGR